MSNGTETTFKPGSMGSIKDLLRKANERKNGSVSWQSGERGRVGGESPPKEEKVHNVNVTKDEKEDAAVNKENEKATATQTETAAPPSTPKTEPATPTTKPTPPKTDDDRQPRQKPRIRTASTTSKPPRNGSFKEIEDEIYNFDYQKERGTRHWIFLPADVSAALYYAYGDRRVSAVISTILRRYIKAYRDDLRQSIEERSNLFTGQDE